MKILHINRNYVSNAIHQTMMETLSQKNVINDIFAPISINKNENDFAIRPDDNVYIAKCFNRIDSLFFSIKQKKIMNALLNKYNPNNFDIIHAYTLFTDGNVAMSLSKKYSIPYVVAVRNTDVNDFFKKMIHLRKKGLQIMKNASAIFFLSDEYRKQVFEKYVPEYMSKELYKKTFVIPNGINDFWFDNVPQKKHIDINNEVRILYVGHVNKNKNIVTTQKALEILRNKGYKICFEIVGKVDDEDEFHRIMRYPNTLYNMPQPKEKLIQFYSNNDIFVMPSITETFGVVYAEAMSQGLPVIYSKGQGFDGQFLNGQIGFSVDSGSADSVAEGIEKIINNYSIITSRTREYSKTFLWGDICEKYYTIYEGIKNNKLR